MAFANVVFSEIPVCYTRPVDAESYLYDATHEVASIEPVDMAKSRLSVAQPFEEVRSWLRSCQLKKAGEDDRCT